MVRAFSPSCPAGPEAVTAYANSVSGSPRRSRSASPSAVDASAISPSLKQAPSLCHQLFKTGCVDIIRTDIEGIAGVGGEDRRGTEGPAQLADLGLQGVDRVGHLPVTP